MHLLQVWLLLLTHVSIIAADTLIESAVTSTGASAGGNFSLAHDSESSRGRIGINMHHQRLVPGAAPPDSKSSSKNAKRRSRAKV